MGAGIVITEKEESQPSTKIIANKSFKVPEGTLHQPNQNFKQSDKHYTLREITSKR